MRCVLCNESIENHRPEFHSLKINDQRTVDVCDVCARKFIKWQGEKLAKLFPTRAMKKLHRKR